MSEFNNDFSRLLKTFNDLVEKKPSVKDVEKTFQKLETEAINNNQLAYWQKKAITDRCKFYREGTYGNTKDPSKFLKS